MRRISGSFLGQHPVCMYIYIYTGCNDRIGTRNFYAKKKCNDRIGTRANRNDRIGTHFYACIVV